MVSLSIASRKRPATRPAGGAIFCGLLVLAAVAAILSSAGAGAAGVARSAASHRQLGWAATRLDWPTYLRGVRHWSATTGPATITPGNAGRLKAAWLFQEQPPTGNRQPQGGFSASPTVADGMVFIGSQTGDLYALSESTGRLVWKRTLDYEQVGNNGHCLRVRGIVGTATVAADPRTGKPVVYVPGARYLYALDAATGRQLWKSLVGPRGSARVVGAYFNYASPNVTNGLVYEGVSSSCNAPFVRGGVQSFSQHTGRLRHSFWTDPPGHVGASVWSSAAVTKSWVWVTTGDPLFTGAHLYHAYSVLRLNARTLALRGAFQLKLGQAADLDFGSSPTLFHITVRGVPSVLVGACSKDGRYYALRRDALGRGPIWSVQVGAPAHTGRGMCLASAVWSDGTSQLYLAGNATTINGHTYDGSVREVNPVTGKIRWATGLGCGVVGTPTLDAATGVLAVPTLDPCRAASLAVYLLNAASGRILGTLPLNAGAFAQPVFAGKYLFVADESGQVTAYTPASTAGRPHCTGWCTTRRHRTPQPPIPAP